MSRVCSPHAGSGFSERFCAPSIEHRLCWPPESGPVGSQESAPFLTERMIPPLSMDAGALLLQQLGLASVPVMYLQRAR